MLLDVKSNNKHMGILFTKKPVVGSELPTVGATLYYLLMYVIDRHQYLTFRSELSDFSLSEQNELARVNTTLRIIYDKLNWEYEITEE